MSASLSFGERARDGEHVGPTQRSELVRAVVAVEPPDLRLVLDVDLIVIGNELHGPAGDVAQGRAADDSHDSSLFARGMIAHFMHGSWTREDARPVLWSSPAPSCRLSRGSSRHASVNGARRGRESGRTAPPWSSANCFALARAWDSEP